MKQSRITFNIDKPTKDKFKRAITKLGYKTLTEYFRSIIRSVAGLDKKE